MQNKRGKQVYIQAIKDEHGFVKKLIKHLTSPSLKVKRAKPKLAKAYQK